MIVSRIGLVDDATPSGGDTMNTSSTECTTKRSGPIDKIKKLYKRTPLSDKLTDDLMSNKVETGSTKVNLYIYYFTCESVREYMRVPG